MKNVRSAATRCFRWRAYPFRIAVMPPLWLLWRIGEMAERSLWWLDEVLR